jgi:hypothetical protein
MLMAEVVLHDSMNLGRIKSNHVSKDALANAFAGRALTYK